MPTTKTSLADRDPLHSEIAELVRRSLLELGDMERFAERLKEISAKIAKNTPAPPSQESKS